MIGLITPISMPVTNAGNCLTSRKNTGAAAFHVIRAFAKNAPVDGTMIAFVKNVNERNPSQKLLPV
jgi:hypothetical protein